MANVKFTANNNHIKDGPDVEILMNGGTQEGGPNGHGKRSDPKGKRACPKSKKIYIAVVVVLTISLSVSAIFNIIHAAKEKVQAIPCPSTPCPLLGWSQHGDSCYLFSDKQQDWKSSLHNCSSQGASLITLDSEEEWDLIKSKEDEYWLDLQRQEPDQPWKWPNGSVTEVKGAGLCGYMAVDGISSTNCDNVRPWVCKKPVHAA